MTKTKKYTLHEYAKDVRRANEIYDQVIFNECCNVIDSTVNPKTDEELMLAKSKARALRNQHLGVAGKRLRAEAVTSLLNSLEAAGWDMTATLAVNVTKRLLGRAIERNKLIARYGSCGRTASDKSKDFKKLDTLEQNPIFIQAQKHLEDQLNEALKIRKRLAPPKEGKAFTILQKAAELNRQL